MAFTVEDGTGLSNSNSYISVADADDYMTLYGYTSWASLSTAEKETALVQGTQFIDNQYRWPGIKASTTQALNWPRTDAYDCNGYELLLIPQKLEDASCEAAIRSTSSTLLPDSSTDGDTKKVKVDVIEQEYFEGTSKNNPYTIIDNLLIGNCIALGNIDQKSNQLFNLRT